MYAVNEAFAYEKLRAAQGSIVPRFYGTHQFTLPNGMVLYGLLMVLYGLLMVLYGLLMEYVEGCDLDPDFGRTLSPDRRIDIV
ncbi:hypothetical protein BDZ97DRAFT_572410 [Flammula alnicola]|nr:hypothetical protein BDZ97DRAFT_572410 [Flammula alnicola]